MSYINDMHLSISRINCAPNTGSSRKLRLIYGAYARFFEYTDEANVHLPVPSASKPTARNLR